MARKGWSPPRSKYRNKKVQIDNIVFDSIRESKRYQELKLLMRAGAILELQLQPKFTCVVNGDTVCTYRADFSYFENGEEIIEDVKGFKTPVYKLKKRLVEALYKVEIREV